jgi:hypothetical protein
MLDVLVFQESYIWCRDRNARCRSVFRSLKWCRDRNARCGSVAENLQMVQGQAGMLHIMVLQESYRWCGDSNTRCGGVAGKP